MMRIIVLSLPLIILSLLEDLQQVSPLKLLHCVMLLVMDRLQWPRAEEPALILIPGRPLEELLQRQLHFAQTPAIPAL
jgi:hypothetical protein